MNPTPPPESRKPHPSPPVSAPRPLKETAPQQDSGFDQVMEKIALEMAPDFWNAEEKK